MTPCKLCVLPFLLLAFAVAQTPSSKEVASVYPEARTLYLDLHQNPELSMHETQTAAKLAAQLRSAGYEVTEHVGVTGIVAILRNGSGSTIMLRTELDALPVEEKTGLPYASKVHAKDDSGADVPVMHALRTRSAHGFPARGGGDHGTKQEHVAWNPGVDRAACRGDNFGRGPDDCRWLFDTLPET